MFIPNSARHGRALVIAATLLAVVASGQFAAAQEFATNNTSDSSTQLIPLIGEASYATPIAAPTIAPTTGAPARGPLARLVKNPDETIGVPPYALTDQTGTVQRLVEPVPGIDLDAHVGQVVVVRHDTGATLLASQLELPPPPLIPMLDSAENAPANVANAHNGYSTSNKSEIQQVQYVDNDDTSVQLLPEDVSMPGAGEVISTGPEMMEGMPPNGAYPEFPGDMPPAGVEGAWAGPPSYDPMQYGPEMPPMYGEPMSGPMMMEMQSCPTCGGYHSQRRPCRNPGNSASHQGVYPNGTQIFADIELNFLRPQFSESVVGKLSEEYQLSPRVVVGVDGLGVFDGRVRFWHYGRNTDVLNNGQIRLEFNVLDVEAIHRFAGKRSQALLAAGVRFADIELTDNDDDSVGCDLAGLTFAADGYTRLRAFKEGECGWVYGGRLSLLSGDWGGDLSNDFQIWPRRDDNVVTNELYAGIQVARRCRDMNVYARASFEIQNWQSDVFAGSGDVDSIGFLGPGLALGADF